MLKSEPNDSFLNYALALEFAKLNEQIKSIELIETLLEREPAYLGAYYQLGKSYEQTNNAKMAIDAYSRGIEIAKKQNNKKAESELKEALFILQDE
jgi:predicted Zn-dependent protease